MSLLEQQLLSMDSSSGASGSLDADSKVRAAEGEVDVEDVQTVLRRQRNLLRTRCDELHQEVNTSQKKLTVSTSEAERLKNDNMELFRKIKYLQSHASNGNATVDMEDGNLGVYRKAYEQNENPFSAFRSREKQEALQSLNIAERMTHSGVNLIVNHKPARTLVFLYCLALHALVFMSLWHAAHGHHSQCCACSREQKLAMMHGVG